MKRYITLHTIAGNQVAFERESISVVFQAKEQETSLIYVKGDPEPIHCQETWEDVMRLLDPTGTFDNKNRAEAMEIARPEESEEDDD